MKSGHIMGGRDALVDTLSRHRPLTIAVGKCLATLRTAIRICLLAKKINKPL